MDNNRPSFSKSSAFLLSLLALLTIAISLYVRVRLLNVPLERDEGEYAYMAQLLLKGIPPYVNAYTMKLPGVALWYALFMSIFGQSATGIHAGLLVVNLICILMIYLLGKLLLDENVGYTAAGLYALISISENVMGIFAHATHFVVLFSMTGIYLLQRALEKDRKSLLLLSGVSFGLAFLMKQHAILLIPFALYCQIWQKRKTATKLFAADSSVLLLGAAIPYSIVLAWLIKTGVFDKFWFWTVEYAKEYATERSIGMGPSTFYSQFLPILLHQLPVWLLAGAGVLALFRSRRGRNNSTALLIGYLITSFIMICPGFYFRPHYFVLILPAIALLAAYATTALSELPLSWLHNRYKAMLPPLLFALTAAYCMSAEKEYLFSLTPLDVSSRVYGTNPFPEAIPIAEYIRRNTTESDRIAILGSEPEILFYARRLSATGHIYMYGLMEKHKSAERMQAEVIAEIEASRPAFIVVVHNSASWLLSADSINKILDWGDSYIPLRYDEVGIIDIFGDRPTRYLWNEAAAGYEPESDSFVSVYRRRW